MSAWGSGKVADVCVGPSKVADVGIGRRQFAGTAATHVVFGDLGV